jgi:uncharacterized protein YraI
LTQTCGHTHPCLFSDVDHDPVLDTLDGNGQCGLPARLRPCSRSDLDGKFGCLSNCLSVEIATIKFSHQGLGYIIWFDISVKNSSFHVLDYNPFISGDDVSSYFMYGKVYVMKRFKFLEVIFMVSAVSLVMLFAPRQVRAYEEAQQSSILATVIYAEQINVRGGPSTVYYPIVGSLNPGDIVTALGVSPGREWVKISFPSAPGGVGWVYATFVSISGGELQIVEPPPTPTPFATATINPTFAAAFISQPTSTRMPTFTPPPPLEIPQYPDVTPPHSSGIASGLIVISLLLIGAGGYLVSLVLNRQ